MHMYLHYIIATPSTEESRVLTVSQEIGDNYFTLGNSDQPSPGQHQTPLNPEAVEKNKKYLKAMDNFQVSTTITLSNSAFFIELFGQANLIYGFSSAAFAT